MASASRVNGFDYDWSSMDFVIDGVRFSNDLKKIDYDRKRDRGMTRGKGPKRRSVSRGKQTCTASFTIYKMSFERLKDQLLSSPLLGPIDTFEDVPFNLVISYEEGGVIVTDTLIECRINSTKNSNSSDSQDVASVDVELDLADIVYNGEPQS